MNHEQEEADRVEAEVAGFIADKALVTNTEMVAAGKVEESSDPLVMFRRGVEYVVGVMMIIREEYNIDAEEEAVRAPTTDQQNKMTTNKITNKPTKRGTQHEF